MPQDPSRSSLRGILSVAGLMALAWSFDVRQRNHRASLVHRTMVELLLKTLCAGDPLTARHSRRVADLTDAVGRTYRFNRRRRARLRVAALLHDVGKLDNHVAEIVRSSEPLSDSERDRVQRHAYQSADILEPLERIHPGIAEIVEGHHERWNGTGYPRQLRAEQIPLESRIISVADVFDAMTQPRSYHEAATPEEVLRKIREEAGSSFDPDVIQRLERPQVWSAWREIAEAGYREEQRHRAASEESTDRGETRNDPAAEPQAEISG